MKFEINKEIVKMALDSKCSICGKKIMPWHLWTAVETQRGSIVFSHKTCLFQK